MIEEKLEIVIPTYNRGNFLDETLNSLFNSPLKNCKITIRDNASIDNTPEICDKYSKLFNNFSIIRNDVNIGGNANILRSYEKASFPYVWVLADNDLLNFDHCDEFINAIESDKYDLIICSSSWYVHRKYGNPTFDDDGVFELIKESKSENNYLENNAQDLALILKKYFFIITTFIPSTIYRTSIINDETLIKAYDYISISHPQFAFINKSLNENLLTYKTKKDLVLIQENPDDWEIGHFSWFTRYLECATLIEDKKFQKYMIQIYDWVLYPILARLIVAKAMDERNLRENVFGLVATMLKLKGVLIGFLYSIVILLAYFVPKKICEVLVKLRFG